jgi:hypothetical protein
MGKELIFNKKTQGKDLKKFFYLYSVVKREYEKGTEIICNSDNKSSMKTLENKIWNEFEKVLVGKIVVIRLTTDEEKVLEHLLSKELENIKETNFGTILSDNQEEIQKSIDEFIDIAEKFSLIMEMVNDLK